MIKYMVKTPWSGFPGDIEKFLTDKQKEGWEFRGVINGYCIFKKTEKTSNVPDKPTQAPLPPSIKKKNKTTEDYLKKIEEYKTAKKVLVEYCKEPWGHVYEATMEDLDGWLEEKINYKG